MVLPVRWRRDDEGRYIFPGQLHHCRRTVLLVLLSPARGRRRDGHVLDEHVDVPEMSGGRQAGSLVLRHQVREGETVEAGLLPVTVESLGLTAGGQTAPDWPVVRLLAALSPEPLQVADVLLQSLQLGLERLAVSEGSGRSADCAREQSSQAVLVRSHRGRDHGEVDQVGVHHYFALGVLFKLPDQQLQQM